MDKLIETIRSDGFAEFSYHGATYLIQEENNKGWRYLSLWRTAPDALCIYRVFFDDPDEIPADAIRELLDRPFPDGDTLREVLQSPETGRK